MADSYTVVSQTRSVKVVGPTHIEDVQVVGVETHPSGIYFEYPVPFAFWRAGNAGLILEPLASHIEYLIANTAAVTGSYVQDVDESGLLVDYIEFVVEYVPPSGLRGPQQTLVRVTEDAVAAEAEGGRVGLEGSPTTQINRAYAQLEATANL